MPCQKGMAGCRYTCGHRLMVEEYRAARNAAEELRENATHGFYTEIREYGVILTFQEWLRQRRH